jgi:hypothetical protein
MNETDNQVPSQGELELRAGMSRIPKYSKLPTTSDLIAFTGMHCANLYQQAVADGWRCPSCWRSAQELVRWTEITGPSWRARYGDEFGMGFTVTMARHHCHGLGRFQETLICGDCNSADGAAKRKHGLPTNWSFSPEEIARFVSVAPHSGATQIDYALALKIYEAGVQKNGEYQANRNPDTCAETAVEGAAGK